jgi:hypothetical protein
MDHDRSRRCKSNCYVWLYQLITQPRQTKPNAAATVLSVSRGLQSSPAHTLITFQLFDKARNDQDPMTVTTYRGAGKSLARPGRKQATATEDFDFHISYL